MKNNALFFLSLLLCLLTNTGFCQEKGITDNPRPFKVDNYYAFDANGNWIKYCVVGFYSPGSKSDAPSVSLFPNLSFNLEEIQFQSGNDQLGDSSDYKSIKKITIPFSYSTVYPNDSQAIGIVSQINGKELHQYIPEASKTLQKQPYISPYYKNHPMIAQEVNSFYAAFDKLRNTQNEYLHAWSAYKIDTRSIEDITISLQIDGGEITKQVIYRESKLGSYELSILDPSPRVSRDLRKGKFKLLIAYRFKDPHSAKKNKKNDLEKSIKITLDGGMFADYKADLGILGSVYNPSFFNVTQPCVLITAVADGSPLLAAGVNSGEIIWKINEKVIGSQADLSMILSNCKPGQNVDITLIDLNRNTVTKKVKLGKAPFIQ